MNEAKVRAIVAHVFLHITDKEKMKEVITYSFLLHKLMKHEATIAGYKD